MALLKHSCFLARGPMFFGERPKLLVGEGPRAQCSCIGLRPAMLILWSCSFKWSLNFQKNFKQFIILHKVSVFFLTGFHALLKKVCILNQLQLQWSPYQKNKTSTWMIISLPDFSRFKFFTVQCFKSVTPFVVEEWYPPTTAVHLQTPTVDRSSA